jgi:hypothetical protein
VTDPIADHEMPHNSLKRYGAVHLRCDAFGCDEIHPLEHECLGDPGYGTGRWLGWLYLDLNRPDLFPVVLRFCSTFCLYHWIAQHESSGFGYRKKPTKLDEALRAPCDEVARRRAGLEAKADA